MLRNRTKTFAGLVTLACAAALLSLPTESLGQSDGHKNNTQTSYKDVMTAIQRHWPDMRGGWKDQQNTLTTLELTKPEERQLVGGKVQVRMQYNFNYYDPIFGVGGTHSLLDETSPHLPGKLYNIAEFYLTEGTVPLGTADGVNSSNTPWLSKAGEIRDYLNARPDQWELEKNPFDDGSVFQRAAQVSGMYYDPQQRFDDSGNYANNYIVEMWVDKDGIFRPNLHQSVDITEAGSFDAVKLLSGKYVPDTTNPLGKDAWLLELNGQLYNHNNDGGPEYAFFELYADTATEGGGFYNDWWTASYEGNARQFGGPHPNAFPWTGIGYTYDWYYQNFGTGQDWGEYWQMDGNNDDYTYGQGLAEYVMLQSSSTTDPINFEITNVQTTYQYMGGTNGPWAITTPEPTTLTIFGMACLAGLGMHRRRRR